MKLKHFETSYNIIIIIIIIIIIKQSQPYRNGKGVIRSNGNLINGG